MVALQAPGECLAQSRQVLIETKFIEIGIGGRSAGGDLILDFNGFNNEVRSFSTVRPFFSVGFGIVGPAIGNANLVAGVESELYFTPKVFDIDFPRIGATTVNAVGKNYAGVTPYLGIDIPLGASTLGRSRLRLIGGATIADKRVVLEIENNGNRERESSSQITVSPTIGAGIVTNVTIPDGQTTLLSGLNLSVEGRTQVTFPQKTPALGNLPFVGGLFRQERDAEVSLQLVVHVTPRIINPP